jgi:hypothetical protein
MPIVNPTIISESIAYGSLKGGDYITFGGTGFVTGAVVLIGGVLATNINVVSATQITCKTPAGTLGLADVTITNTDTGTVTMSAYFTFITPSLYHTLADVATKFKNIVWPVTAVSGNSGVVIIQSQVLANITQTEAFITATLGKKYVMPCDPIVSPIAYQIIKKACIAFTANDIYQIIKSSSVQTISPDDTAKIATYYYEGKGIVTDILSEKSSLPDLPRKYPITNIVQSSGNNFNDCNHDPLNPPFVQPGDWYMR